MSRQLQEPTVLTIEQQRVFVAAADRVLPGKNLPGAVDAGVENFLLQLSRSPRGRDIGRRLQGGLELLQGMAQDMEGKDFDCCSAERRDDLLSRVGRIPHSAPRIFLSTLVRVSLAAVFSHPAHGGNRDEVGWRWLGRHFPRRGRAPEEGRKKAVVLEGGV